jgi:hypothetical protein
MSDRPALKIKSLEEDARPARLGTRVTRMPAEMLANSTFDREEEPAPSSSPQE